MDLISLPQAWQKLAAQQGICVTVLATQGSVPRGPSTRMLVFAQGVAATIGGGHLELQAIAHARALLAGGSGPLRVRHVLGPSLGQCCGGVVELGFEAVDASDAPRLQHLLAPAKQPVALFGGGHVGRAIARVLSPLPFALQWIDSRDDIFPHAAIDGVQCEHSLPVHAAVADLPAGTRVLIMSFSHAEDFDVVMACLQRQRERADLPFVGLIGSRTKWAAFASRLRQRGFSDAELAAITCPIGVPGIADKAPEVIAIAVAAQLLQLAD